ncbi:hypothetical protein Tco_0927173 [Tanacetum coccineum]
MDSGSSCEIIYEHCFKKLNPTTKSTKVTEDPPLVGFLRERSWSIGEVPLEITIGDAPLSRTETLNFVIVRYHQIQMAERRQYKMAFLPGEGVLFYKKDVVCLKNAGATYQMLWTRNEKETQADFLVEIPFEDNEKKEKPKEVPNSNSKWRLYTDGASKSDGSGAGLMLIDPEGKEYTYALRF